MRRSVGISGIQKQAKNKQEFAKAGEQLAFQQLNIWNQQLEVFSKNLQEFATKYKNEIKKDGEFRNQFQKMCSAIGVDPLASNKGFFAEMLGFGDFYYELGIQVAEVSIATREKNGGLLPLDDLKKALCGLRKMDFTDDDIIKCVAILKTIGNEYDVIQIDSKKYLQSVCREQNHDFLSIIELARTLGFVTEKDIIQKYNWSVERIQKVLENLICEGIFWIDEQSVPISYWLNNE